MDNIREMNRISGSANQSVQKWISAILALLPGSNCGGHGGCGLKSCQECAESIAQGAAVALCPACSQEAVDAIAGIVGTESMPVVERIAYIRCSGDAAGKKRLSGEDSCQQAREKGFLNSECRYGCIGLGSCVERCTFNAMSAEDGQGQIDREKCNGCGACIDLCPQQVILLVPREATNFIPCASENDEVTTRKLCGSGCIGCGDCQEVCPQDAISMVNNCAVIDYDKCVGCVACTVKCRKKIIVDELHDLRKLKETVAFVRCRGGKKAQAKFKALGVETCTNAEKIRSRAMGLCQVGCIGLGECVEVCRYDAIAVVDGTAQVDPEKCVGCLDCVAVCPSKLIVEVPYGGSKQVACASTWDWEEKLQVCGSGCIGCGDCSANCPNGAITMENKRAVVDSQLCENCKICSYLCSRTALVELEVPEETYLQRRAMGI